MKGEQIPEDNHIARYCGFGTLNEYDRKPTSQSFRPRRTDGQSLSVNWMEYYGDMAHEDQISCIRDDINLKLKKSGLFAVLNVGDVVNHIRRKKVLSVLHDPIHKFDSQGNLVDDPSHSVVNGYSYDDLEIAELIAQKVLNTYPAKISST